MVKLWVMMINREDFRVEHVKKSSMLCSAHFVDSDYKISPSLLESLGQKRKNHVLKKDAVPSVFAHKQPKKRRHSTAAEKRNRHEVG